ncbi:hypothetical protein ACAG20_05245 [Mycobacterium sp. pW045]
MEPENIEERVTALEAQVGELNRRVRASEHDAQAARVLAGAADRDVADLGGELRDLRGEVGTFRGEVGTFRGEVGAFRGEVGAFRGEFTESRGEFHDFRRATVAAFNALRADMNDRFSQVNDRFGRVDKGFIEMRGKFDAAAAGQQEIVRLIQGLIDDRSENGR